MPKVKRCTQCGEFKQLKDFYPRYDRKSGERSECKTCFIQNKNERRRNRPRKLRDVFLGY